MSILDGMISSKEEMNEVIQFAAEFSSTTIRAAQPTPRLQSILDEMKDGLSLGDILGLTKAHRDALLNTAIGFVQAGETEQARDVLIKLIQLEPLDERPIYVLASTYQMAGDYPVAGKLYVQFLALDATNPDGHMRLGECFMGAGELKEAVDCFRTASRLAAKGKGRPGAKEQADRLIAAVTERQGAAGNA